MWPSQRWSLFLFLPADGGAPPLRGDAEAAEIHEGAAECKQSHPLGKKPLTNGGAMTTLLLNEGEFQDKEY